jgi:hypothetical protein
VNSIIFPREGLNSLLDIIFDDLEKLFNDPGNDTLRQQVEKTISDRLGSLDALKGVSEDAENLLRTSTSEITEIQSKLGVLSNALSSPDVEDMLADRDPTPEDVQDDLAAVSILQVSQHVFVCLSLKHQ